jgi:hypothetical protein
MTAQQVFNRMVKPVLTQACPSTIEKRCLYRGLNGAKCAVGHLIPDRVYNQGMEQMTVANILEVVPELDHKYREHLRLMYAVQSAHDGAPATEFLDSFCRAIVKVANNYNLKLTWVKNHPNWRS